MSELFSWLSFMSDEVSLANTASVASILALFVALAAWIIQARADKQTRRSHAAELNAFGAESYDEQQILAACDGYVQPDCSQLDLSLEGDARQAFTLRLPLVDQMDALLSDAHHGKHVLLLADSGVGKTSFLLHYYARNRTRPRRYRTRIVVVPLGRKEAAAKITRVEDKKSTIIFLDAFDEDTDAIRDAHARLKHLMELCADFKRVVISCRTQFFASDEEIPRETGIAYVGPREAGKERIYTFYKLYIAPFNEKQVSQYLSTRYGFWQVRKRRAAAALVRAIPELSTRPMLLAVIPGLVDRNEIVKELYDLYALMIERWLDRERDWIDKDELLRISKLLALDLYSKRYVRGTERIPISDLHELIRVEQPQIEAWKLTSRSLLNRDGEGNFKFAHRSILEFIFIKAFVEGEHSCCLHEWTDLMRQLFLSWTNSAFLRNERRRLVSALANDFRRTGMFPILQSPRGVPKNLGRRDIEKEEKSVPLSAYAGLSINSRAIFASAYEADDALMVCDVANDCVFCLPLSLTTDEKPAFNSKRSVYYVTRSDADKRCAYGNQLEWLDRADWHVPTLAEFDQLLALMNGDYRLLNSSANYWSSDRLQNSTDQKSDEAPASLVVTLNKSLDYPQILASRAVGGSQRAYGVFQAPHGFPAFTIFVSHGRAEELSVHLSQRAVRVKAPFWLPAGHYSAQSSY